MLAEAGLVPALGPIPKPAPLWLVALFDRARQRACAGLGIPVEKFATSMRRGACDARRDIARRLFGMHPHRAEVARAMGVEPKQLDCWMDRDAWRDGNPIRWGRDVVAELELVDP